MNAPAAEIIRERASGRERAFQESSSELIRTWVLLAMGTATDRHYIYISLLLLLLSWLKLHTHTHTQKHIKLRKERSDHIRVVVLSSPSQPTIQSVSQPIQQIHPSSSFIPWRLLKTAAKKRYLEQVKRERERGGVVSVSNLSSCLICSCCC